jgi:4-hydroxy-2-oxoheptanedioate aldolase
MIENRFKTRLSTEEQLGFRCALGSPQVAELLSHLGFTWITVDAEHSVVDLPRIVDMDRAMCGGTAETVVRMASRDPAVLGRYLDAGLRNFILPAIDTAEQARAAVLATRYPPHGSRGISAAHRGNHYGEIDGYLAHASEGICIIAQLESAQALANLEEILAVEGLDGVYLGPADLAASLGHTGQPKAPVVEEAIAGIAARCAALRIPCGVMAANEADARLRRSQGFSFIALGTDTTTLRSAASASLRRMSAS